MRNLFCPLMVLSMALGVVPRLESLPAPAPAATQAELAQLLKSPEERVRADAAEKLGKGGKGSAVAILAGAVNDPSDKVRRKVVIALDRIRYPSTLTPLIQATEDSAAEPGRLAVLALVNHYTGGVLHLGVGGAFRSIGGTFQGGYLSDDRKIDPDMKVSPEVIQGLDQVLKRNQQPWPVQRASAWALGVLLARSSVPTLVTAAHSPDEHLARASLNALAKLQDRSAGPLLLNLLNSAHTGVRRDAALTAGLLQASEAVMPLTRLYQKDADKKVREKALEGLAYLGKPESAPLFLEALKKRNKNMRMSAAEGLARTKDPQWLDEVKFALGEEEEGQVRLAMAFALCAMGSYEYTSDLVQQLGSRFRRNYARTYLIELSRIPDFRPQLYLQLGHHAVDVRVNLCRVLLYHGDQATIDALKLLTEDDSADVAIEALRATRVIRAREMARGGPSPQIPLP